MIVTFQNKSQFSVSAIPNHLHDNIGSPKISYKNLTNIPSETSFGGSVASSGTATFLPKGWTSVRNATGDYTITHNLKLTNYSVTTNAIGPVPTSDILIGVFYSIAANSFSLQFVFNNSSGVGTTANTAFDFILKIQS